MRKAILSVALAVTMFVSVGLSSVLFPAHPAGAAPPSRAAIESRAVKEAKNYHHLRGDPTHISSTQLTLREANAYLGEDIDRLPADTLVWLVMLRGTVQWSQPPRPGETLTQPNGYNNMWVLLDPQGDSLLLGAQAPGYELDFSKPPRPTPTPEIMDESTKDIGPGQAHPSTSPRVPFPTP